MSAIDFKYVSLGPANHIGSPIGPEIQLPDHGLSREFQNGTIFYHPNADAHVVEGLIRDRWNRLGSYAGHLGYPLTDELTTKDGKGRYNHFQHGSIFWTPVHGAIEVFGPIRERWAELRWERGLLGYPIASPVEQIRHRNRYLISVFEHGRIELEIATGQVFVQKEPSNTSPNYEIPLTVLRVANSDGTRGGTVEPRGMQQYADYANLVYAAAGVKFTFDGTITDLHDSDVNQVRAERDEHWNNALSSLQRFLPDRRYGLLVVWRGAQDGNKMPGSFSSNTYDFVAMDNFSPNDPVVKSILAHELGHHFGLPHTFGKTFKSAQEASDFVLSGRSISELDGDKDIVNDTPPDPWIDQGSVIGDLSVTSLNLGGLGFNVPRKNIMSYWWHGGPGTLSHGQIERVWELMKERKQFGLIVRVVRIAACAAVFAQLDPLRTQLAEAEAELKSETDPKLRGGIARRVARLKRQIQPLELEAEASGCI